VIEQLDKQFARLRTRLAKTPVARFFVWWWGQLLACLPASWQAFLVERSEVLLLDARIGEYVIFRENTSGCHEFGRISMDLPNEAQTAEFQRLRAQIEDPQLRIVYCLRPDRILRRELNLPMAAAENLRQVLSFEMDRQTPFKADQVYFDSRIAQTDAAARQVRVELILMPRTQLETDLSHLIPHVTPLDGVDCWNEATGNTRRKVNLLPVERRARHRNVWLPLNLGLASAVLLLLIMCMAESLANRSAAVEAMRSEVEKANAEAKQVAALKKTLQDSMGGANFLSDKKRQIPPMIALLDDVTKRLPDDTYLERFNIENKQVQLQGQSKEAATLIGQLQPSPYLNNPAFQGQIQPDPRTGKERFQITAELKQVSKTELDAAPAEAPSEDNEAAQPAFSSEIPEDPGNGG